MGIFDDVEESIILRKGIEAAKARNKMTGFFEHDYGRMSNADEKLLRYSDEIERNKFLDNISGVTGGISNVDKKVVPGLLSKVIRMFKKHSNANTAGHLGSLKNIIGNEASHYIRQVEGLDALNDMLENNIVRTRVSAAMGNADKLRLIPHRSLNYGENVYWTSANKPFSWLGSTNPVHNGQFITKPILMNDAISKSSSFRFVTHNRVFDPNVPIRSNDLLGIMAKVGKEWRPIEDFSDYVSRGIRNSKYSTPNNNVYPSGISTVNKALSQEDAVANRASRMLSQSDKWIGQDKELLANKFKNAVQNHNPDAEYNATSLGANQGDVTLVSKFADLTDKNKARIASHEVGHYYRNTRAEGDEWNKLFNWGKLNNNGKDQSRIARKSIEYLSGKGYFKSKSSIYGDEIRERAGQLKDFIAEKRGIPLNQDFNITMPDLKYAINNYSKETGLDNEMTKLFSALKSKKDLMNMMNKSALGVFPIIAGNEDKPEVSKDSELANTMMMLFGNR